MVVTDKDASFHTAYARQVPTALPRYVAQSVRGVERGTPTSCTIRAGIDVTSNCYTAVSHSQISNASIVSAPGLVVTVMCPRPPRRASAVAVIARSATE